MNGKEYMEEEFDEEEHGIIFNFILKLCENLILRFYKIE